jgi:hypothetical protein
MLNYAHNIINSFINFIENYEDNIIEILDNYIDEDDNIEKKFYHEIDVAKKLSQYKVKNIIPKPKNKYDRELINAINNCPITYPCELFCIDTNSEIQYSYAEMIAVYYKEDMDNYIDVELKNYITMQAYEIGVYDPVYITKYVNGKYESETNLKSIREAQDFIRTLNVLESYVSRNKKRRKSGIPYSRL